MPLLNWFWPTVTAGMSLLMLTYKHTIYGRSVLGMDVFSVGAQHIRALCGYARRECAWHWRAENMPFLQQ
jgi:hypothetical protein